MLGLLLYLVKIVIIFTIVMAIWNKMQKRKNKKKSRSSHKARG